MDHRRPDHHPNVCDLCEQPFLDPSAWDRHLLPTGLEVHDFCCDICKEDA